MKKSLIFGTFMLSALVWAGAQQPSSAAGQSDAAGQSGAQTSSPSTGAGQSTTSPSAGATTAPSAGATATPQAGGSAAANAPITEGCLGGSSPNFTLTDKAGKTYSLMLPATADGSKLTPHVGESIQVLGQVSGSSINVNQIGKGTGTCPAK